MKSNRPEKTTYSVLEVFALTKNMSNCIICSWLLGLHFYYCVYDAFFYKSLFSSVGITDANKRNL